MSLYIRKHLTKSGELRWYLELREYRGDELKRTQIPRHRYATFQVSPELSYEQAVTRVEQLNAQERLARDQSKRLATVQRVEQERLEAIAFLPALDIAAFEVEILAPKFMGSSEVIPTHKVMTKWRAALQTMRQVKLDPSDWFDRPFVFQNYWKAKQYSPSYVERIIALMNLYGYYYCRKHKSAFMPLPKLSGRAKVEQTNAYRKKYRRGLKSEPLAPEQLEAAKDKLSPPNYNWLYISVWLGLRPEEIDALQNPDPEYGYKTSTAEGVPVLHIYQSKLQRTVDEDERWKLIPLVYPEQRKALTIIQSGKFKRPLVKKTLQRLFGARFGTYCGRKGFVDLMKDKGQILEDISLWMGHKSLDRTIANYKNHKKVHFKKAS